MPADSTQGHPPRLSAAELVSRLGGPGEVAKACGISTTAVSMWYARGRGYLPYAHHAALWRLAQAKGVEWTPPGYEGVRLVPADHNEGYTDDNSLTNRLPEDRAA